MALLEVDRLSVAFTRYDGAFRQSETAVMHDLHVEADRGEIVAVIGSSGSGKSLLAHALLGILPDNAVVRGTIRFDGEALTPRRLEALRGRDIALVPQSVHYLDPLMRVGAQVRSAVHNGGDPVREQREAFARLRLPADAEKRYPHQLSGGMARRVLVSTATVSGAKLLVADEPTPGLDPAVVGEALARLRQLADEGAAVLLISHDIESALRVADRVAVFYAGTTVELASAADFAGDGSQLRHPYSRALWRALPQNGFVPIAGFQPHPAELPEGCLFAPRCGMATAECSRERPAMRELRGGKARCIHAT
ncbi:ABC transporter ATP-binding protein [Paenibacillus flagellatus]|uniref:Nickel import system ATP-binding protein NikD n=1 Tax=Paenibacillus flagellatus TaxID=2211139 RepID=A0A2V5K0L3_9BACL|nr:ABC transporter ATP-binding protein [Paenibacillus flagellatus]PYI52641.1 peptide ABC transporter ATP-binding protein [Paenibacillus flagellatus]